MTSSPGGNQADRRYLGAISGTSVDGLDVALIRVNAAPELGGAVRLLAHTTLAFPDRLRTALLNLGQDAATSLDALGAADTVLGRFIGEATKGFIAQCGLQPGQVHAIGSHGQTVRHRPAGANPFTMQIGDPNLIAEITGITTVADFRRRDLAAGGQGAPLAPGFHQAILQRADERRVVLNIGGISNLSLLETPLTGFDTGPGNALMDAWCAERQGAHFDADGAWAAAGVVHEALLKGLMADPFLAQPPPKSTGREHYNLTWLRPLAPRNIGPEDVQRTLLEFTAASAAQAIERWAPGAERIIVCGGGRLNPVLMRRLAALAKAPVEAIERHGWNGDAIEAAAFAWLAAQRLRKTPANNPEVTGARGGRVLGAVYPP